VVAEAEAVAGVVECVPAAAVECTVAEVEEVPSAVVAVTHDRPR
jgi:hypothetical protein